MNFLSMLVSMFVKLEWIGKLIEKGIITPAFGRILEWSVYSFLMGLFTYVGNALESGDRSDWKLSVTVLWIAMAKTIVSGIAKSLRDKTSSLSTNPV